MALPDPQPPPVTAAHLAALATNICGCAHQARLAAVGGLTHAQLRALRPLMAEATRDLQTIWPHLPEAP